MALFTVAILLGTLALQSGSWFLAMLAVMQACFAAAYFVFQVWENFADSESRIQLFQAHSSWANLVAFGAGFTFFVASAIDHAGASFPHWAKQLVVWGVLTIFALWACWLLVRRYITVLSPRNR